MTKTELKRLLNLRLLFYAISTCFTIVTMFYPISCKKQKENASQESVEILRKEHERLKQSVQVRVNVLSKRSDSLQNQLKVVRLKLGSQTVQHQLKRAGIMNLVRSIGMDSSSTPYDSIRQLVGEYVSSDEHQDSLYESSIETLEQIIVVKDSTLEVTTSAFDQAQQLTAQSITAQQELGKEITGLGKKLRRKQFINKALAASTLILAGATAVLIIR